MIIVEGPDGSGKTTVLGRVLARYGASTRIHLKSLQGGIGGNKYDRGDRTDVGWGNGLPPLLAYTRKVRELKRHQMMPALGVDRFHLSERVYGPLLRNTQLLNDNDLDFLGSFLKQEGVPVILCLPSFDRTMANVMLKGRERPAYQTDAFLRAAYDEFTRLTRWATVVYNYEIEALPTGLDQVARGAQESE
jgi:hypothetical protein